MASSSHSQQTTVVIAPATSTTSSAMVNQPNVISRKNLQNLAKYVDPNVQLDEEVEDVLLSYSDEFMEQIIEGACKLAVHRKSNTLDAQDLEAYLERHQNMWLVNDEKDDAKPIKKASHSSEAHKQRLALIKKTLKKY